MIIVAVDGPAWSVYWMMVMQDDFTSCHAGFCQLMIVHDLTSWWSYLSRPCGLQTAATICEQCMYNIVIMAVFLFVEHFSHLLYVYIRKLLLVVIFVGCYAHILCLKTCQMLNVDTLDTVLIDCNDHDVLYYWWWYHCLAVTAQIMFTVCTAHVVWPVFQLLIIFADMLETSFTIFQSNNVQNNSVLLIYMYNCVHVKKKVHVINFVLCHC